MFKIAFKKSLHAAGGTMSLDIDFKIQTGSFVTLYGNSGAGKTSILRMLAGLLKPDSGCIITNGKCWLDTEKKINLRPQKRSIGLVFQDYALFPNMSVLENLEFALEKNGDRKVINDLIEVIELGDLQSRKPTTLSGGQQQRVALARALVRKPSLLLLDEPLSALDLEMRKKLQAYLLKVHREFKLTTILVSHDASEILHLSDQLIHLENGKITQQDSPQNFFVKEREAQLLSVEREGEYYKLSVLINGEVIELKVPTTDFDKE